MNPDVSHDSTHGRLPVAGGESFRNATLAGTGVGSLALGMLAAVLAIMAELAPGGGAVGSDGATAGHGSGAGTGTFASPGAGSGEASSDDGESAPAAPNEQPVEITESQATENAETPSEASEGNPTRQPVSKASIAPFSIAALPAASDGDARESSGSGRGFSDVEDRLAQAGAKGGDVQISLAWNNYNDLDLHVLAPSGERILFSHRKSACGGELDVDMNAEGPDSRKPVENVYWPAGSAPRGEYVVIVHHYANHGGPDPTQYQVVVKTGGRTRKFTGSVSFGDAPVIVHRWTR